MYIINDTGAAWMVTEIIKNDVAPDLNEFGDYWSYRIRFDGFGNDQSPVSLHCDSPDERDDLFQPIPRAISRIHGTVDRSTFRRALQEAGCLASPNMEDVLNTICVTIRESPGSQKISVCP